MAYKAFAQWIVDAFGMSLPSLLSVLMPPLYSRLLRDQLESAIHKALWLSKLAILFDAYFVKGFIVSMPDGPVLDKNALLGF